MAFVQDIFAIPDNRIAMSFVVTSNNFYLTTSRGCLPPDTIELMDPYAWKECTPHQQKLLIISDDQCKSAL